MNPGTSTVALTVQSRLPCSYRWHHAYPTSTASTDADRAVSGNARPTARNINAEASIGGATQALIAKESLSNASEGVDWRVASSSPLLHVNQAG